MRQLEMIIAKQEIEQRVAELAGEISRDYRDRNPLLVDVLKGSFVFLSDLIRGL